MAVEEIYYGTDLEEESTVHHGEATQWSASRMTQ